MLQQWKKFTTSRKRTRVHIASSQTKSQTSDDSAIIARRATDNNDCK